MGSILVVFAGVLYYRAVLNELEDLDRLLYQKSRVMAVNAKYDLRLGQLDLENVPLLGSNLPPLGSELVYARWYNTKGQLVQFFGTTSKAQLTMTPGFHTIKTLTGSAVAPLGKPVRCGASAAGGFPDRGDCEPEGRWGSPRCSTWRFPSAGDWRTPKGLGVSPSGATFQDR